MFPIYVVIHSFIRSKLLDTSVCVQNLQINDLFVIVPASHEIPQR